MKVNKIFRFKVCVQYFKFSRYYTNWQASPRLEVSIIAHCHWTRELDFFIFNSSPPFSKMHHPRGVYTDKYGRYFLSLVFLHFSQGATVAEW